MTLTATTTPPVSGQQVPRNKFEFSLRFHMVCISQLLELTEFCRVAPISTPSSLPAPSLNQGPFPPPALPSFVSTTGLSATPSRPTCPSRASSWSFARPRYRASRVARAFLVCMPSQLPRRSDCGCPSLFSTAISAFPICVDGSACASSFSRIAQCSHYITACTLAKSPNVTLYIEGFSHFVTSMTAPITSGWSDFAGWGLHPLEQRHLFTAHTHKRQSALRKADSQFQNSRPEQQHKKSRSDGLHLDAN